MPRKGYHYNRFRRAMNVLDRAAHGPAALEEFPIIAEPPPRPGVDTVPLELDGYFDENPSPYTIAATGIGNKLNGILYVRRTQTTEDLRRSADDGTIAAGWKFHVRGRQYRCMRADYARGEYAFLLNDLGQVGG